MKKQLKGFVVGSVLTAILMFSFTGFAESISKTINVFENAINIKVNGKTIEVPNYLIGESTYIPLRAVSEMLGKDVLWDETTSTASINDKIAQKTPIQAIIYNGCRYYGEVLDGKPNGFGKISSGSETYIGEWKDGKSNGIGYYSYSSGDKYLGELKSGIRSGIAIYTWAENNNKFVGEFKEDYRNGVGTYFGANNTILYGFWNNDKYTGQQSYQNNSTPTSNETSGSATNQNTSSSSNDAYIKERISQFERDLAELKVKIENVSNERNVKVYQNGEWVWVADPRALEAAKQEYQDKLDAYNTFKALFNIQ